MITIHLRYEIDPHKLADFEEYGRRWIHLVNRLGGTHHGYFLPSEGDGGSPRGSGGVPLQRVAASALAPKVLERARFARIRDIPCKTRGSCDTFMA
jgi:NIPSNAP